MNGISKVNLTYQNHDFFFELTFEDGTEARFECEGDVVLQYIPGKSTLTFTIERVVPAIVKGQDVEQQTEENNVQLPKEISR